MDILNIVLWFTATLILVLGPLILVHEIGHFFAARRAGVRVEEFGMGFPPRALTLSGKEGTLEVDGTRIVIPARFRLPWGLARGQRVVVQARCQDGVYHLERIKLLEHASQQTTPGPVDQPRECCSEHDRLVEDEYEPATPQANAESDELRLRGVLTSYEPGMQYTLNWIPLGGFVRMTGEEDPSDPRSMAAQPKRWRVAVLLAGPLTNVLAAFLLLVLAFTTGAPELFQVGISMVDSESAAAAAGFQPDDVIVSIDGTAISGSDQLEALDQVMRAIQASAGTEMTFVVQRGSDRLAIRATPALIDGRGFLGIGMFTIEDPDGIVRYSLPRAASASLREMGAMVKNLVELPRLLLRGDVQPSEVRPTSVVGINQIMTLALQQSVSTGRPWAALNMAAMISLALGLANLLPLPALDGGRILFIVIEAVRGQRVRPELEGAIHFVAMMVLLALILLVMVGDIFRPVLPWELLNR